VSKLHPEVKELRRLAREEELHLIEYPDGRMLVIGGVVNVHYWPNSKRMTSYAEGAPDGKHYQTAKQVIKTALAK
jgi:hypothetical protein